MPAPAIVRRLLFKPSYQDRVLRTRRQNLIGYWPLSEQAGSVAYDLSGNGRNGAYTGVTFNVPGVNLLSNGGFETPGAGGADVFGTWAETAGDGAVAAEAIDIHGGAKAAKLTAGATNNTVLASNGLAVVPGQSYQLTFWTRGDGVNQGRFQIYDNTHGASIGAARIDTGVTGTVYALVTHTFVAPADCLLASVNLRCPNAVGASAYFDDVSVTPTSANGIGDGRNAPYFDGVNDYVNIYSAGLAGAFNGAEGTLLVWGKVANAGVWTDGVNRAICRLSADASNSVLIQRHGIAANRIQFVRQAGGSFDALPNANGLTTLDWIVTALTWSQAVNQSISYLNGAALGVPVAANQWAGATNAMALGANNVTPNNVFSGTLAHAALWSCALTPAEIAAISRV